MTYNGIIIKTPFIPYFTTSRYRVETMVELSNIQPNQRVADLGSGDGRISIAFGAKGGIVTGYELDEKLFLSSKALIKEKNLEDKVEILKKDFWEEDLGQFDIICIYPMPDIMDTLQEKILEECKKGTKILTNYYIFSEIEFTKTKNKIYLYELS